MSGPVELLIGGALLGLTFVFEMIFKQEKVRKILGKRTHRKLLSMARQNGPQFWKESRKMMNGQKFDLSLLVRSLPVVVSVLLGIVTGSVGIAIAGLVGFGLGQGLQLLWRKEASRQPKLQGSKSDQKKYRLQTQVIRVLIEWKGKEAGKYLSDWTRDFQSPTSGVVMMELARQAKEWMLPFLLDGMRHPKVEVREAILDAFIESKEPRLVKQIPAFNKDFEPRLRSKALRQLNRLPYKEAEPFFTQALRDEDANVRKEAAATVRDFRRRKLAEIVEQLKNHTEVEEIQWRLNKLGQEIGKVTGPALMALDYGLSRASEDTEVAQSLVTAIGTTDHVTLVAATLEWMGRFSGETPAKLLIALLSEKSEQLRRGAGAGLLKTEVLEPRWILAGLDFGNIEFKRSAFAFVDRFDADSNYALILKALEDPDLTIRRDAVHTLSRLKELPNKIELIEKMANDRNSAVREQAYRALEKNAGLEAIPILVKSMKRIKQLQLEAKISAGPNEEINLVKSLLGRILDAEQHTLKGLHYFYCKKCLTRSLIQTHLGVKIPVCRRCGQVTHLTGGVGRVMGKIGPDFQGFREVSPTIYQVDLWNADTRKALYADLEDLELMEGLQDHDWAINAVVETLLNGAPDGKMKVPVRLPANMELSPNSERILKTITQGTFQR